MPSVLLLIARGSEEMETVITADVLRRAQINVTIAAVECQDPKIHSSVHTAASDDVSTAVSSPRPIIECSRKVNIVADTWLNSLSIEQQIAFDCVVLPGGMEGSRTFAESPIVQKLLQQYMSSNKLVAAICAAPIALQAASVGTDRVMTSYPTLKEKLEKTFSKYSVQGPVIVDGNLITSQGPGTSFAFSLAIVEYLCGVEVKNSVAGPMLL